MIDLPSLKARIAAAKPKPGDGSGDLYDAPSGQVVLSHEEAQWLVGQVESLKAEASDLREQCQALWSQLTEADEHATELQQRLDALEGMRPR